MAQYKAISHEEKDTFSSGCGVHCMESLSPNRLKDDMCNYSHKATDYRDTDKQLRLVMTRFALCCTDGQIHSLLHLLYVYTRPIN